MNIPNKYSLDLFASRSKRAEHCLQQPAGEEYLSTTRGHHWINSSSSVKLFAFFWKMLRTQSQQVIERWKNQLKLIFEKINLKMNGIKLKPKQPNMVMSVVESEIPNQFPFFKKTHFVRNASIFLPLHIRLFRLRVAYPADRWWRMAGRHRIGPPRCTGRRPGEYFRKNITRPGGSMNNLTKAQTLKLFIKIWSNERFNDVKGVDLRAQLGQSPADAQSCSSPSNVNEIKLKCFNCRVLRRVWVGSWVEAFIFRMN